MSREIIIVDHRLESLIFKRNPVAINWVLARNEKEIRDLMFIGSIKKALIHQRFTLDRKKGKSALPPIVLVFDKAERPPSLRTMLYLMPRLDIMISRVDIERDLESVVTAPPFFSSWSTGWPDAFPEEMRGLYQIYQKLKFTRQSLTPLQWDMFRAWSGTGGVEDVARNMGYHPKTIRNNLKKISSHLGVGDIDQFSKYSVQEFIKLVSYIDP